jgi:hypothetical protein
MKKIFLFPQLVLCAAFAAAQPVIVFDGGAPQISDMDIKIWLLADNAITRYEIVLSNPSAGVLDGEFDFKFGENQNIDSFAVDGQARPAAGLKTAIYLPPKTARRLQFVLEEKLQNKDGKYYYELPAAAGFKAANFRLRAEILRQAAAPEIKESPFADFEFVRCGGSYCAVFSAKDYELGGNLIFAAPAEAAAKAYTYDADGNTYFFAAVPFEPPTGAQHYILQSISYDKTKFDEVYPAAPQPAQNILNITGIINVKEARLDLRFTAGGKTAFVKRVYIDGKARSPYARGVFLRTQAAARII